MPDSRPTISTHVLDLGSGAPAPDVPVRLWRRGTDGNETLVGGGLTDGDGRIHDLLGESPLETGAYRMEFGLSDGRFFTGLSVDLRVDDPTRTYHVPLLRAPFGLSTYRGS